MTSRMTVISEE